MHKRDEEIERVREFIHTVVRSLSREPEATGVASQLEGNDVTFTVTLSNSDHAIMQHPEPKEVRAMRLLVEASAENIGMHFALHTTVPTKQSAA